MTTIAKTLLEKVRIKPLKNRDEATQVALVTAKLELEKDKAALLRDERIEALKAEFALQIEQLESEIERNTKALADWATKNRSAEFGKSKTISLGGHKLAFREGTGKVEFLSGHKEADVLGSILVAEDESIIERFVKVTPKLDKNAVLSAWRSSTDMQEFLSRCGITVVKVENFSFEADRDAVADVAPVQVGKEEA